MYRESRYKNAAGVRRFDIIPPTHLSADEGFQQSLSVSPDYIWVNHVTRCNV